MVHGPQGSGKTFLAKTVADTFKVYSVFDIDPFSPLSLFSSSHPTQHDLGGDGTQIVHVSLHPGFKRDDLFRLLHINGEGWTSVCVCVCVCVCVRVCVCVCGWGGSSIGLVVVASAANH